jgi:tRNA(Ile)-lysidine synthase
MEDLRQRVHRFIQKEGLVQDQTGEKGRKLLVGVSGGPDSVCLLHILDQLKESLGVRLHIAHLNHMLRGLESDADASYVKELSDALGIPATFGQRDVDAYHKKHSLSLEAAAHEVRYDFFLDVAESIGAVCIALGHTQDDQVETILMNLVRGTGITGLRGMRPVRKLRSAGGGILVVARPLIEVTRRETEEYCRVHKLNPRIDYSNFSLEYTRNRIRHELVPLLRQYNRNIDVTLMRAARVVTDELSFIEPQIYREWDRVVQEQPNGLLIDKEKLLSLHPALQRHLLRKVLGYMLGDITDIESVHIEKIMEALSKPAGKRLSLPRGLFFHVGYHTCLVVRGSVNICPLPVLEGESRLNVPGETELPGWLVRASIAQPVEKGDSFAECLDLDAAGTDLVVRRRKAGDRFQPLGMGEPKRLQDFMVDAKIPRLWRDRIPLVCSPDGIIWVVGWRIAESVKVANGTRKVLWLKFEGL